MLAGSYQCTIFDGCVELAGCSASYRPVGIALQTVAGHEASQLGWLSAPAAAGQLGSVRERP